MSKKNSNSKNKIKKILVLGIENSGKTSIVLSLTRNTNLLSYCNLKPTVDIDRIKHVDLGTEFSIWDFGGQKKFREKYMKNLEDHFRGLDKLIYVIDVQDVEKYDLSLEYLEEIVEKLKTVKNEFELLIFIHKFDPNLNDDPNFSDEKMKSSLFDKIPKIIPSNFNYKIFKTTIYTVFQKTLVH